MLIGSLLRTAIAVFALLLAQAIGSPSAVAQEAQALAGTVSSAEEGAMEGVIVSAKKDGSTITVSVITDEQGHYSLPGGTAGAGRLQAFHPRRRLRPRRRRQRRRRQRPRHGLRSQAAQDPQPQQAAHQCRMDDEHARHRRRQAAAHQLRELPHARTGGEIDPRCRRVRAGDHAHERLCAGEPADQAAARVSISRAPPIRNGSASWPNSSPRSI